MTNSKQLKAEYVKDRAAALGELQEMDETNESVKRMDSVGLSHEISELHLMVVKLGENMDTLTEKLDFILNNSCEHEEVVHDDGMARKEELPTISQAAGNVRSVREGVEAINLRLIATIWRVDL